MRLGEFIRIQSENKGLTLKELALALSVDIPMLSRYERNLRPIKEEHLPILATIFQIEVSKLRKLWVAEKVLSVVNKEKNATDILNIVAERLTEKHEPNYES